MWLKPFPKVQFKVPQRWKPEKKQSINILILGKHLNKRLD